MSVKKMTDKPIAIRAEATDWLCVAQWVSSHLADLDEATEAGALTPDLRDKLHDVGMRMLKKMTDALNGTGLDVAWAQGVKADHALRQKLGG